MSRRSLVLLILLFSTVAADAATPRRRVSQQPCAALPPPPASTPYAVRYDQLGYLTAADVSLVVMGAGEVAPRFRVVDATTGCTTFEGRSGPRVLDTVSRASNRLTGDRVDVDPAKLPATFLIVLEDGSRFGPINVGIDVYRGVLPSMLQFLRVQRCGPTDAAVSLHASCHLYSSLIDHDPRTFSGDGVIVPYGDRSRVTNTANAVNVEGGWHDAGDYLKFVGTTSFMLSLQLLALRDRAEIFRNEPAGAVYEPMRVELRWGIDWLLKMVDRNEPLLQVGGEADHEQTERMPETDTRKPIPQYEHRPAVQMIPGMGRNLLARSAAVFAVASQVYADDPAYASRLLAAARTAYTKAGERALSQPTDPSRFYNEQTTDDDMAFGAAELARATGASMYRDDAVRYARRISTSDTDVNWGDLGPLAIAEAGRTFEPGAPERVEMANKLVPMVARIAATSRQPSGAAAAFRYALPTLGNGSIAESLGAAVAVLAANRLAPSADYRAVARAQLHWLFGHNPFGLSFMIGQGQVWPKNPHHTIARLTGATLHGAIVGGPTARQTLDRSPGRSGPYARFSTDDLLYEDDYSFYEMNEPAIDFHAPLVYVLAELLTNPN